MESMKGGLSTTKIRMVPIQVTRSISKMMRLKRLICRLLAKFRPSILRKLFNRVHNLRQRIIIQQIRQKWEENKKMLANSQEKKAVFTA